MKSHAEVEAILTAYIDDLKFPCVAAKAAFHHKTYHLSVLPDFAGVLGAVASCEGLYAWEPYVELSDEKFLTYIIAFPDTEIESEARFEELLWQHLQLMHNHDKERYPWDPSVSDDVNSPNFGFSIGGKAYFVAGLNQMSSRIARTVPFPVLVFNMHSQFERLREEGKFERMRDLIRERDKALQGSINPAMADFGESSEALQYSGRDPAKGGRCPFHK